jgi:hypothetical protein
MVRLDQISCSALVLADEDGGLAVGSGMGSAVKRPGEAPQKSPERPGLREWRQEALRFLREKVLRKLRGVHHPSHTGGKRQGERRYERVSGGL